MWYTTTGKGMLQRALEELGNKLDEIRKQVDERRVKCSKSEMLEVVVGALFDLEYMTADEAGKKILEEEWLQYKFEASKRYDKQRRYRHGTFSYSQVVGDQYAQLGWDVWDD